jgi:Uma2 family endonuclease
MFWNGYIPLDLPAKESMTEDEFFNFCAANKHIKIERDENGQILIMPPSGLESDSNSVDFSGELYNWNKLNKSGIVFGSSAGFTLPDKSVRSPDAAWVSNEKWKSLSEDERKKFGHISPDFIVEVMSPSDDLGYMQNKMELWMKNGVRLGWLIDPEEKVAYIYRSDGSVTEVNSFMHTLTGENVLPGFSFSLSMLLH